ncbi:3-hydroxyacyl-CoA dehydrogenase [Anopheles sinensis]|uniref:3-hydroxyacyl-CoA dehydrogenase n=1 Tax=Anopheles sinensis TaxID=74873 RepID=A0A084WBB9_ANOSI|nr:3-hydroxyacyl-CoA dehydrogenase [Anopheles sinensis]
MDKCVVNINRTQLPTVCQTVRVHPVGPFQLQLLLSEDAQHTCAGLVVKALAVGDNIRPHSGTCNLLFIRQSSRRLLPAVYKTRIRSVFDNRRQKRNMSSSCAFRASYDRRILTASGTCVFSEG